MSTAIPLRFSESQQFLVETDTSVQIQAASSADHERFQLTSHASAVARELKDVQDLIVSCCTGLLVAIKRIPQPEAVAIEFGVKLAGEAGVPMITKATGEANFKVSVTWKRPESK